MSPASLGLRPDAAAAIGAQIATLSRGKDGETMRRLLVTMLQHAPNASPDAVARYVETSYCPFVARRADLDELSKTQMAQAFSADLRMMLK